MTEDKRGKVVHDTSKDFNLRLNSKLEQIDLLKQNLEDNKEFITSLSERLHTIYIMLSSKMDKDEMNEQQKFKKKIQQIKIFSIIAKPNNYGGIDRIRVINRKKYYQLKEALEEREMAINKVLERLGFTAIQKEKRLR